MRIHRLSLFASVALLFPACTDPDDQEDSNSSPEGGIEIPGPSRWTRRGRPGEYLDGIDGEFTAPPTSSTSRRDPQAVGYVETQWQMIEGEEEFEGSTPAFGAMALRGENLTRGAELLGVDVDASRPTADQHPRRRGAAQRPRRRPADRPHRPRRVGPGDRRARRHRRPVGASISYIHRTSTA
jgi:hypothetical protein